MSHPTSSSSSSSSSTSSGYHSPSGNTVSFFAGALRPWGSSSSTSASGHDEEITTPRIIRPKTHTQNMSSQSIPTQSHHQTLNSDLSRFHNQQQHLQRLSLKSMVPSSALRPHPSPHHHQHPQSSSKTNPTGMLSSQQNLSHRQQQQEDQQRFALQISSSHQHIHNNQPKEDDVSLFDPKISFPTIAHHTDQFGSEIQSQSHPLWMSESSSSSSSFLSDETVKGAIASSSSAIIDSNVLTGRQDLDPLSGIGNRSSGKWTRNRLSLPHSSSSDAWELASPTIHEHGEYIPTTATIQNHSQMIYSDPNAAPLAHHRRLRNSWHNTPHSPTTTGAIGASGFISSSSAIHHPDQQSVLMEHGSSSSRRLSSNLSISTSAILDQLEESITTSAQDVRSTQTHPSPMLGLNVASSPTTGSLGRPHREPWKVLSTTGNLSHQQYTSAALAAPPSRPVSLDFASLWDMEAAEMRANTVGNGGAGIHSLDRDKRFSVPSQFESMHHGHLRSSTASSTHSSRHSWQSLPGFQQEHQTSFGGRTISEDSLLSSGGPSNRSTPENMFSLTTQQQHSIVGGGAGLYRPSSASSTHSGRMLMGGRITPQSNIILAPTPPSSSASAPGIGWASKSVTNTTMTATPESTAAASPLTPNSWGTSPHGSESAFTSTTSFSFSNQPQQQQIRQSSSSLHRRDTGQSSQPNMDLFSSASSEETRDWFMQQQQGYQNEALLTPPDHESTSMVSSTAPKSREEAHYHQQRQHPHHFGRDVTSGDRHVQGGFGSGHHIGKRQSHSLIVDTSANLVIHKSGQSRSRLASPTIQAGPNMSMTSATIPNVSSLGSGNGSGKNVTLVGERLFSRQLEQMNRSIQSSSRSSKDQTSRHPQQQQPFSRGRRQSSTSGGSFGKFSAGVGEPSSKRTSSSEPIGLFIWGFPESVGVKEMIQEFSGVGRIMNVGIDRTVTNERYALIDFEDAMSVHEAIDQLATRSFFGMSTTLSFRLRYEKGTPLDTYSNSSSPISLGGGTDSMAHGSNVSGNVASHHEVGDADYRSLLLKNCPHNINKPKVESVFARLGDLKRIKIIQRSTEKCAFALLYFRTADQARKAFMTVQRASGPLFKDMSDRLEAEYPVKSMSRAMFGGHVGPSSSITTHRLSGDLSKLDLHGEGSSWKKGADSPGTPLSGTAPNHLIQHDPRSSTSNRIATKKAKKAAAAENRIVYIRELKADMTSKQSLALAFSQIGPVESFVIISKASAPEMLSAFVVFPQPNMAASAVALKAGGCTLPRHKRVDLPGVPLNLSESEIASFFKQAGEIKQIVLPREYAQMVHEALGVSTINEESGTGTCMIEYVTSMGAAKAIVLARQVVSPFMSDIILSDYSPSLKPSEESQPNVQPGGLPDQSDVSHGTSKDQVTSDTLALPTRQSNANLASQSSTISSGCKHTASPPLDTQSILGTTRKDNDDNDDDEVHVVVEEEIVVSGSEAGSCHGDDVDDGHVLPHECD